MVIKNYIPKRGDVVWLNFSPTIGHEQSGRRPALVLSPKEYNKIIGLAIVVPVTKKIKNYSFEVPISFGKNKGVVLSDHVRSLAYKGRNVEYITTADDSIVGQVIGKIKSIIE